MKRALNVTLWLSVANLRVGQASRPFPSVKLSSLSCSFREIWRKNRLAPPPRNPGSVTSYRSCHNSLIIPNYTYFQFTQFEKDLRSGTFQKDVVDFMRGATNNHGFKVTWDLDVVAIWIKVTLSAKIELNPLSSCQVIILIARTTFNCSTSCLMS